MHSSKLKIYDAKYRVIEPQLRNHRYEQHSDDWTQSGRRIRNGKGGHAWGG